MSNVSPRSKVDNFPSFWAKPYLGTLKIDFKLSLLLNMVPRKTKYEGATPSLLPTLNVQGVCLKIIGTKFLGQWIVKKLSYCDQSRKSQKIIQLGPKLKSKW